MSNVIDFLERLGKDARLRHASDTEVAEALKLAGIEPAVLAALVSKDQGALERLLGADTNVCCLVNAPDEEEEETEEDEEEDDEDDDEDDEDEDEDEDDEDDEDEIEDEEEDMKSLRRVTDRVA